MIRIACLLALCVAVGGCVATSAKPVQTGAVQTIATTQPVTASLDDIKQAVTATVGTSVGRMEAALHAALTATVSAQADVAAVRGDLAAIKGDVAAVRTEQTASAGRDVNVKNLSGWPLLAGVLGVVLIIAASRIVDGHLNRRQRERHVCSTRQWVGDS